MQVNRILKLNIKNNTYMKTTGECEVTWRGLRVKQPPIINYAFMNNEQIKICIKFEFKDL